MELRRLEIALLDKLDESRAGYGDDFGVGLPLRLSSRRTFSRRSVAVVAITRMRSWRGRRAAGLRAGSTPTMGTCPYFSRR